MAGAITDALESASELRTVVITGVEDAFCAGGMLEPDALTTTTMRGLYGASLRMFDAIRNCPRPVNGPAAGGGNELFVACDLAIAAESATFGQTSSGPTSAMVIGERGRRLQPIVRVRRTAAEGPARKLHEIMDNDY